MSLPPDKDSSNLADLSTKADESASSLIDAPSSNEKNVPAAGSRDGGTLAVKQPENGSDNDEEIVQMNVPLLPVKMDIKLTKGGTSPPTGKGNNCTYIL